MAITFPWTRGTEAARAANSTVPAAGMLAVTSEGNVYAADGSTAWNAAARLARASEVAVKVGKGDLVVNVADYGAIGDGTTDDTAALQAAVTAIVTAQSSTYPSSNGAKLLFPTKKNFRISAALNVPKGSRFVVDGAGSTITQAANNTPIFYFTKEDTWGFTFQGLTFAWANSQPATNTSAICLAFDPDTNQGHGFYNWRFIDIHVYNGFRCISFMPNNTNTQAQIWGLKVDSLVGGPARTGGLICLDREGGAPNISIQNVYTRGDGNVVEPEIYIASGGARLESIEFNQCTNTQIRLLSCSTFSMRNVRAETVSATAAGVAIFDIQNSAGVIDTPQWTSVTWALGAGNNGYYLNIDTGSTVSVNSPSITNATITSGNVYAVRAAGSNFIEYNNLTISGNWAATTYPPDGSGSKVRRSGNAFNQGIQHGVSIPPIASGVVAFSALLGDIHTVNLTANVTSSTIASPNNAQIITIDWIQDATGGRTYTWPTNCVFAGNNPPRPSMQPGARDSVTFRYSTTGSSWYEISRAVPPAPALWGPLDNGLLAWTQDPIDCSGASAVATAGTLNLIKLRLLQTSKVTNVALYLQAAGATLTSGQCFAALFTSASVLVASTTDQSTTWASSGFKEMALTGGPYTLAPGDYYVGVYFNGTTGPSLLRGAFVASGIYSAHLTTPNFRVATANTGLTTAMPSTAGAQGANSLAFWAALS